MYHELPRRASFWLFLFSVDQDLAETTRQKACSCGGRLHRANYPRKPRGNDEDLPPDYDYRFSFCCDRDGCRKRVTPPSVRFLGRKVYLLAVVVLVSAMRQGPSPRRVRELSQLFGADRRTIARWQVFWRELVPQTPFWKSARGRLPPMTATILPRSLVDAFLGGDDPGRGWEQLLHFLSPITITGGLLNTLS
ncbi:MAG TPA: hypothetical protein VN203_22445 [Candidatus Acidoferrum sp.]|nr:hypothetical protein [Candidatus Acidoferrum sp.]